MNNNCLSVPHVGNKELILSYYTFNFQFLNGKCPNRLPAIGRKTFCFHIKIAGKPPKFRQSAKFIVPMAKNVNKRCFGLHIQVRTLQAAKYTHKKTGLAYGAGFLVYCRLYYTANFTILKQSKFYPTF